MTINSSGTGALIFASACHLGGAIGLTYYYLTWWADSAAAVVGYPAALFVVPPAIWFVFGASFSHAFLSPRGVRIKAWQFGIVSSAASLVFPIITVWAMSQPH